MKIVKLVVLGALAYFHAAAFGGEFFVSVDGGRSELDLETQYLLEGDNDSTVLGASASVNGGYITDINIVLSGSHSGSTSDALFGGDDDYELYETRLMIGYQFIVAKHFRIVPNIGVSRWRLTVREGALFNPGEEEKHHYKGTERFGQLNLEFPVNDLVVVYASFSKGSYDFGTAEALRTGVKFEF